MRAPSSRTRKIAGFAAGPLAIVAAGAMVWQGSSAAFTASTEDAGNNWATGQIALTDNDSSAATFTASKLVPGATGTKCITVTATSNVNVVGTIHASVAELAGGTPAPDDFSDTLFLTMKYATPATGSPVSTDCANFPASGVTDVFTGPLSVLAATKTAATAAPAGTAAAATAQGPTVTEIVYMISYKFDATGLDQTQQNALMNKTTGAKLVWEMKAGA